jgi:hypothetical protein
MLAFSHVNSFYEAGRRGASLDVLEKLQQSGAALQQISPDRLFYGLGISRHKTVDHVQMLVPSRIGWGARADTTC